MLTVGLPSETVNKQPEQKIINNRQNLYDNKPLLASWRTPYKFRNGQHKIKWKIKMNGFNRKAH